MLCGTTRKLSLHLCCAAKMYNPEQRLKRDPNYDGAFSIITLAEFLNIANNNSMGVLIGIQVCVLGDNDKA